MFLFHTLIALSLIYWTSVFIAEIFLTSTSERLLPASVKVALGYALTLIWFAAAWRFMPMGWVWGLGLLLVVLYLAAQPATYFDEMLRRWKTSGKSYLPVFGGYLICANLFLVPLHIGMNYGPFTEGGGDVSVYADGAKYFTDHNLAVYGIGDMISDLQDSIHHPLAEVRDNRESLASFDEQKGNPPAADASGYSLSVVKRYSSFQFAPTGQWFFLPGKTNYPAFYGVLAFLYASLILTGWCFFRRFGYFPAFLATFILLASQGVISVFYNVYLLQALCLTFSAVMIALLPRVPLFSWAGLRTYGVILAIIMSAYLHYISIILPLLLIRLNKWGEPDDFPRSLEKGPVTAVTTENLRRGAVKQKRTMPLRVLVIGISISLIASAVFLDTLSSFGSFTPLVQKAWSVLTPGSHGTSLSNPYFGDRIPVLSFKYFNFLFGLLSQQHFYPLIQHNPLIDKISTPFIFLAGATFIVGALAWKTISREPGIKKNMKFAYFSLYLAILVALLIQHSIIQGSLYTQAKGSQNMLVAFYIFLMIPMGLLYQVRKNNRPMRIILSTLLVIVGATLLVPRTVLATQLAYGLERCGILESSFFREAEKLRREDPDSFVLFEPRKSADLYVSSQAFAGGRMIPTRDLTLRKIKKPLKITELRTAGDLIAEKCTAADFISQRDLPHLWLMEAIREREQKSLLAGSHYTYVWQAQQLILKKTPWLLLLGDHYDKFYVQMPRSSSNEDLGWFSYLRNGTALIFIPPGTPHQIEVRISPIEGSKYLELEREIDLQSKTDPELSARKMITDNGCFILFYKIPEKGEPILLPLSRFSGEYKINIRLDNKEIYPET